MAELGIIASVVQIADVGLRLSIKLYTFGEIVASADRSVISISKDVSLTSGVLKELGQILDSDRETRTFSENAVQTAVGIVKECLGVFQEMESMLVKKLPILAQGDSGDGRSGQRANKATVMLERLKWGYLQPKLQLLRSNLDRLKSTLLLMLNVITYARQVSGKTESPSVIAEQRSLIEDLLHSNQEYIRKFETLKIGIEEIGGAHKEDEPKEIFPTTKLSPRSETTIGLDQKVLLKQLEHYSMLIVNLLKEVDEAQYNTILKSRLQVKGGIAGLRDREIQELERIWGYAAVLIAEQRSLIEDLSHSNQEYIRKFETLKIGIEEIGGAHKEDEPKEIFPTTKSSPRALRTTAGSGQMSGPTDPMKFLSDARGNTNIDNLIVNTNRSTPPVRERGMSASETTIGLDQNVLLKQLEHYSMLIVNLLKEVDEAQYNITLKSRLRVKGGIAGLRDMEMQELERIWGCAAVQRAEQSFDSLGEVLGELPRMNIFVARDPLKTLSHSGVFSRAKRDTDVVGLNSLGASATEDQSKGPVSMNEVDRMPEMYFDAPLPPSQYVVSIRDAGTKPAGEGMKDKEEEKEVSIVSSKMKSRTLGRKNVKGLALSAPPKQRNASSPVPPAPQSEVEDSESSVSASEVYMEEVRRERTSPPPLKTSRMRETVVVEETIRRAPPPSAPMEDEFVEVIEECGDTPPPSPFTHGESDVDRLVHLWTTIRR